MGTYTRDSFKDGRRRDAPILTIGRPSRDARTVLKTRVASFAGHGYVAEREDDELVVYLVSDEPLPTAAVGDGCGCGSPRTAADMQKLIVRNRERGNHGKLWS